MQVSQLITKTRIRLQSLQNPTIQFKDQNRRITVFHICSLNESNSYSGTRNI